MKRVSMCLLSCVLWAVQAGAAQSYPSGVKPEQSISQQFANPPGEARPWVYWFWSNGSVSKEGITADLEAMHNVGIGGAVIFSVHGSLPAGPVGFMSDEWKALMMHVFKEADRLGMEINMNNADGWTGSGGPWVTPEMATKILTWNEMQITGGSAETVKLGQPHCNLDYYRDIAVVAFPTPAADIKSSVKLPVVTSPDGTLNADHVTDNNEDTLVELPLPAKDKPSYIQFEFDAPLPVKAFQFISGGVDRSVVSGRLMVSDDGAAYSEICKFDYEYPGHSTSRRQYSTKPASGRFYRLVFDKYNVGPTKSIEMREVQLFSSDRMHLLYGKAGFNLITEGNYNGSQPEASADSTVKAGSIVDLTGHLKPDGTLQWKFPAGAWTVIRLGYTCTGKQNHPATDQGVGLECDKFNPDAVTVVFNNHLKKLVEMAGPLTGKTFTYSHTDSWEAGCQNWTAGFGDFFFRKTGYRIEPYIPVLTGHIVENVEYSNRILWDFRRVIADALAEGYYDKLSDLCHKNGLKFSAEAYGLASGNHDSLRCGKNIDMPMTEFWTPAKDTAENSMKHASSIANVYGKKFVGAEAFTSFPDEDAWKLHPYRLKSLGDYELSGGINRFIFHRYSMQPWLDKEPGMTMSRWGLHFERTTTWWNQSKAWLSYISRCQYLMQQGLTVSDVLVLYGEESPVASKPRTRYRPLLPAGYEFDTCPRDVVLNSLSVKDGMITLPHGMQYRYFSLSDREALTPELVAKVESLVREGATVIGKPPVSSPSLKDYPQADKTVSALAEKVWGPDFQKPAGVYQYGKGRVIWGHKFEQIVALDKLIPDFDYESADKNTEIKCGHRRTADMDIYFVSNQKNEYAEFDALFRVKGGAVQIWNPATGEITPAPLVKEEAQQTRVRLQLEPVGSTFVVFNRKAPATAAASVFHKDGVQVFPVSKSSVSAETKQLATVLSAAEKVQSKSKFTNGMYDVMGDSRLVNGAAGKILEVSKPGDYQIGGAQDVRVSSIPAPVALQGSWTVSFQKKRGAPDQIELPELISLSEHADPGVKYFSGTAVYTKTFEYAPAEEGGSRTYLDLGNVQVIAEVFLNGESLGIFWKPPFIIDITRCVKKGSNKLEVRVTNQWVNRLIGDEQYPEDVDYYPGRAGVRRNFPDWIVNGTPRPEPRRIAFSVWRHYLKDDPLIPSGLIGPVQLHTTHTFPITALGTEK
jgi:hypothetical protein